jgi:predicted transcriptional regulator
MTNAEFYENIRRLAGEKGLTLYQLQKKCDGIPESTFFTMFQKKSTPKLDYIAIISRALNVPQGELLEPGNAREALTPVQLELIETVSNQDEKMIRRLIPLIKGVILAETGKQ